MKRAAATPSPASTALTSDNSDRGFAGANGCASVNGAVPDDTFSCPAAL